MANRGSVLLPRRAGVDLLGDAQHALGVHVVEDLDAAEEGDDVPRTPDLDDDVEVPAEASRAQAPAGGDERPDQ